MGFNLAVVLVGFFIAGGIAWFVDTRVTDLVLGQLADRAIDQVQLGVEGRVTAADFEPPFSAAKLDDLAERLDPLLASVQRNGVIRLNVFSRDGTIIYSDVPSLRGVKERADEELFDRTLTGATGEEVSDLSGSENADLKRHFGGALEVYVPVMIDGRVVGVYEIYEDLSSIRPIRNLVWSSILGSLVPLFVALLILGREVTARLRRQQRERERLLQQTAETEALRQLDRMKSELLSAVSHELRTPLSIVHGYAELLSLRAQAFDAEQVRQIAGEINRGSSLMARIVDDLLDFNRIERGRLRLDLEEVDLVGVVRDALEIFAHHPGAERITLDAPDPVRTKADPARISQVVGNLVSNALRYAPIGPVDVRVGRQHDGFAVIEVRDRGPGISADALPHVWEMFYRAPEVADSSIHGTGIGLALVKSLVEAHGGVVAVESAPNQGAAFHVYLPVSDGAADGSLVGSRPARSAADGSAATGDLIAALSHSVESAKPGLAT